ncbi:unnamed protein product [Paramecium pentaurelia]|uniref:Importin subunit beta-1/Transportin-1-like TPR repeats domain-containing protein n=1 Tax=Paramecium pentaurelia TaxID=43138 RepID=A0A8S1U8N5_9CILI|nr:unnamed protein product [Paramecium pentaurelia]
MKMLTEVDRKDWENTFDDNCLQLNDLSSVAEDCLGKMVRDLGVKYLLPIFVPLIMQALRSPVINEQHAGLIAMATLSDKAAEHFQNELPSIMELILPLSQSQNKLIIYDLLTCLASLCQEFTPKIQINYGSQILQLIVTCMQQKISQKIQYISIACLVDFTRELVEDKEAAKNVLTPVSTFLIEQLYSVIQTNLTGSIDQQQQQILEQALSAFSALATSLQEHFTQYYDQMMPYMMQMMQTVTVNEVKSLLLECIGCFLVSISTTRKEQCKTDSNQLVTHFIQQQNKMESDDPAHTSIFFFYTQVATALRCEFGQYLDAIFPLVERAMRLDVGFSINSQAEGKNITKVKLDLKFLGMKSLSLNTSALEQKVEGAHTLVNLAEQCGKSFYPYITKTIVLMKEFINYKHSSQIQKSMAKCSEYLIAACTLETDMAQVLIQVTPMLITEFTVQSTEQHAGLIAMATLSDKAAEHFQNELPSIMELILPLSQSQNKLIIYDLLTCLASLCQEFTPKIQINYGSQILQLIVTCMQQKISQKIQYISIACLVDFTRELVEDKEAAKNVLTPVSTFLIEQLYSVIQTNLTGSIDQQQQQILEQALSAFSALATSLQEHFTQYYDQMMPYMMQMMQTVTVNEVKSLLLECIGCFLVSISTTRKEQCKTDSNQLVTHFIQQQNKMESDDPAHTSIFFFYTQVATALRCEFGQYLDAIFPLVERAMRLDVGFSINSQAEGKNITKVKLDLKFLGMKSLSLNTSALEQKVEGAHTLVNLAEQCGKSFYPYITKTIVLMKEFINYKHSSQIQKSMAKCSEYLIAACTLETDMAQVLIQVTPMLITEFTVFLNSKSYDRVAEIAEVLANCLNQVKAPILDATIIDSMFQTCNKALAAIVKTKESITYEDEEQFEADCEEIDLLLDHITNIATELISNHKCESVQTMMPTYYSFLNTKSTKSQTINSIAFFNIVLPLCNESVFQQAQNEILKCYSTFSKTADLEMKQNLLFGYGNIAKRLPNLDTTQIIELAQTIIEQPDCKHVDKVASYETALTTLGKVAMYCNIAQKEQLLTKFLDSLPHEYQDNQETHLMFIKEVQNNNPTLMQFKDSVIQTLNRIKTQDCNNPENELLCDEGRKLIQQLLC